MANATRTVVVRSGGGSPAGILLLLIAVIGLVMLFTGNLDRVINLIAGGAGGAAGLSSTPAASESAAATSGPVTRVPTPIRQVPHQAAA